VKARASCRPGAERGLTLIEIVVALGILLIGMSAILGLFSFGATLARTAEMRTVGSAAVEALVADLEGTLFPAAVDPETGSWILGEPVAIEGRAVPGYPGVLYSASAAANPAQASGESGVLEYRVDVTMRWKSGGEDRSRRFTTLLLRELSFGESMRRRFGDEE
jgi:prepilin-type N-terminal cleavage/methylation domain-containing protein